jgi:hypothetical protein
MKFGRRIRHVAGRRMLRNEIEPVRLRRGSNFQVAKTIGILYRDMDLTHYQNVHEYAQSLKKNFKSDRVVLLGFVDEKSKKIPDWQKQLENSGFFSWEDLNWHLRPIKNVDKFIQQDFDILIDLSGGEELPLNFVLKESKAGMKVGLKGSRAGRYCDFTIDMGNQFGLDKFVEQLNLYLSNPKIK